MSDSNDIIDVATGAEETPDEGAADVAAGAEEATDEGAAVVAAGAEESTLDEAAMDDEGAAAEQSPFTPAHRYDAAAVHHLSGMYQSWFLDYASYVILERAVPSIDDGLKPVQRRILYSMKRMDDGRYNKAANIVGHTMQFHPHGDASIGDALVQLGQKEFLVDTQGNWGNIFTGDEAAAPRYIEARLTRFALDVLFNDKTTAWQMSYDGRNKEPITLPAKFPLLLCQGGEGIAVGLSSKILPHNFNELCAAAIAFLRDEPFTLYPDFPTGGSIDVARYNGGQRGGLLRVRAKIEKVDSKTLAIREIPYTRTTTTLIDSITRAIEKGKIKVRHVVNNTAADVEILLSLVPGTSLDKTIDALYAFTDCEITISPNCCVIADEKPCFLSVEEVLRHSTLRTRHLLQRELEIRLGELEEQLFFASLERIFIEERIYKEKAFEQAATLDAAVAFVDTQLEPFKPKLLRAVTRDDILRLLEIKMQRILKFNKDKAAQQIARLKGDIKEVKRDLRQMTEVTIRWYEHLREQYGSAYPRRTELRNFDTIKVAKVVDANEKLYINREEGFVGTALKKDEFVCSCSDLDEIIIFFGDGHYRVFRVAEKVFVGKNVRHIAVYHRNDQRATYNVIYRDGAKGAYYAKRFNVATVVRDRDYDLTQGTDGSRIVYFSYNPNGEAETLKINLAPAKSVKKATFLFDFAALAIRGRSTRGNLVTRKTIRSISLKSQGHSTLGGRHVWYDSDVRRLNYDGQGVLLGAFAEDDLILVILRNGDYYFTDSDLNNHYDDGILRIEKYAAEKVWTLVVRDEDNGGLPYVKRFVLEHSRKRQNMLGQNTANTLLLLTDSPSPSIRVTFADSDETLLIAAESFAPQRSVKVRGRRLARHAVATVEEMTEEMPTATPTEEDISPSTTGEEPPAATPATPTEEDISPTTAQEEETATTYTFKVDEDGQMSLFSDDM